MEVRIRNGGYSYAIPKPLCGTEWLKKHMNDHSHEEIENLTMEVTHNDKRIFTAQGGTRGSDIREIMKMNRRTKR